MNDPVVDHHRGAYTVSSDAGRLDLDAIHAFLAASYWAKGMPRAVLDRAVANSLCFGVYEGSRQVGFARAITDGRVCGAVGRSAVGNRLSS